MSDGRMTRMRMDRAGGARRPLPSRLADLMHAAWSGVIGRPSRTMLAALGIALGVAAYVALCGIAASNQTALLTRLDALGANLSVVAPGQDAAKRTVPLPSAAPAAIRRQPQVERVGVFHAAPSQVRIFRNELIPATNGNALTLSIIEPGALQAVGVTFAQGHGIARGLDALPVAVLGSDAAWRLGVTTVGDRILIDGEWYGVVGILDATPQAASLDTAVIIGERQALAQYPDSAGTITPISAIWVRTRPGDAQSLRRMLANAANPAGGNVSVGASADLSNARSATDDSLTTLGLAIGLVALAIGGMSIADVMVVTVMERRGEIGLRMALGATPGAIRVQFVAEAAVLSMIGASAGVVVGMCVTFGAAEVAGQRFVPDWAAMSCAWGAALAVGVLAGLYPASRAARLTPTEALRGE